MLSNVGNFVNLTNWHSLGAHMETLSHESTTGWWDKGDKTITVSSGAESLSYWEKVLILQSYVKNARSLHRKTSSGRLQVFPYM